MKMTPTIKITDVIVKSLLFYSYCLLIFSEVRTVSYHLAGDRSISISDLFFLVIGISFVVFTLIKKKGKVLRQHVKIAMYLISELNIPMVCHHP